MQRLLLLTLSLFIVLFSACDPNSSGVDDDGPMALNFDRQAMLINWADNVIVPPLSGFTVRLRALRDKIEVFNASGTEAEVFASYGVIRMRFRDVYLSWQQLSPFMVGKGEEIRFREQANTYPTNQELITSNILSETYNLDLPSATTEQGLAALDYIINKSAFPEGDFYFLGKEENAGPKARAYAIVLINRMIELTNEVIDDWEGGYHDAYVMNDGNSATASIDRTVNDYIFHFEKFLRAGKVGIPAGVFSDTPLPDRLEARYGKFSKDLFISSLAISKSFFTDQGLADYLNALNVMRDGELLSEKIEAQFQKIELASNEITGGFQETIEADNNQMLTLYDEMQRLVVLLKVDMLQALSINVDFVDADGD